MSTTICELEKLTRCLGPSVPLQTAVVFLHAVKAGPRGVTVVELQQSMLKSMFELPKSTLQRSLQRLGNGAGDDVKNVGEGLRLLTNGPDQEDPRANRYYLTKQGAWTARHCFPELPAIQV